MKGSIHIHFFNLVTIVYPSISKLNKKTQRFFDK